MDERIFARFHLDAGIGDVVSPPLETVVCRDWLGFDRIQPSRVRMIAREQQFAEKLHAYTLPRNSANSRVKNLADMTLLIDSGGLDRQRVADALHLTSERRGTRVAGEFDAAASGLADPVRALAEECRLAGDLTAALAEVQEFLNEVRAQRTER